MNKCDSNIYGCDENSMALSIASDALGAPDSDAHSGSPMDGLMSVGSKGKRLDGTEDKFPLGKEPNSEVVRLSNKSDSRAQSKGNK